MKPKIGLVTITYNGETVVEEFMDSVNKQDYDNMVLYVVDNNSKDRSVAFIEKNISRVQTTIIKNDFNAGVAGGNNQGIKRALEDGCDYVVLINNDTVFEETLISKLYNVSVNNGYSVVVPKMMYYSDPEIAWYAGGGFKKYSCGVCFHRGMGEKDNGQFTDEIATYAPTCCALISKQVFADIGFMNEKYFVYVDDTDFFYRMYKDGRHKMFYINDVHFLHKEGSSTKSKTGTIQKFKVGDFYLRYTTRNRVFFLRNQNTIASHLYILWFWARINLRFFVVSEYNKNFKTWWLIQKSVMEGLAMKK